MVSATRVQIVDEVNGILMSVKTHWKLLKLFTSSWGYKVGQAVLFNSGKATNVDEKPTSCTPLKKLTFCFIKREQTNFVLSQLIISIIFYGSSERYTIDSSDHKYLNIQDMW